MTSRRRNLLVIALTIGLLVASAVVIVTKETKLGLDLKGGVELVYQGEPTPQSEVTPEAIDRAIDIIRERVDRLGVAEPEIQRLGSDQISVGLPGVKNLERAKKQVGTTAQLLLYDWEANVIGSPQTPIAGLYPAVKRASEQKPVKDDNNSTTGSYYLFKPNKLLAAGPDASREDLLSEFDGRVPKGYEILRVPEGTVVLRAERPENLAEDAPFERYFVVRDNPEVRGTDLKDPRQEFDPTTREPIVTFKFTDEGRKNFQEVTRRLAERGQTAPDPGPAGGELLPDLRDRARPRGRLAAVHRLPREPGRHRRPHRCADLRWLQAAGGAGPRGRAEDRRAADQPQADQRDAGLREPRQAGPARGPDRGPRRASGW